MEKKVTQSILRKRGRPAGKNRVPLSQAERRARNAQYERERREGLSDNFADLAAAIGVSGSISNSELLATVITHLQQASRVKHSSDVESLTRCNKNLIAQIEKLEQQLTEPDQACSAFPSQEDTTTPRPVKRKREDYDSYEVPVVVAVPKCSPQEDKYAPLSFCHAHDGARPGCMEQQYFPGPPPCNLPEQDVPVSKHSPQSTLTRDHEFGSSAPKYFKQEFLSTDPWLPNVAMSAQNFVPIPKFSPVSSTSDQLDQDFDYTSYHFAGPQIPTPEYQIESTSECIHLVQPGEEYYHRSPQQCHFSTSPSEVKFSQYLIPGAYQGSTLHSGPSSPDEVVLPDVVGSMGIIPIPGNSVLPVVSGAGQNPGHGGFLSTEEFVSMYS